MVELVGFFLNQVSIWRRSSCWNKFFILLKFPFLLEIFEVILHLQVHWSNSKTLNELMSFCYNVKSFVYLILNIFINNPLCHSAGMLPCMVLIPGLFFIPESPRWLVWVPNLCLSQLGFHFYIILMSMLHYLG